MYIHVYIPLSFINVILNILQRTCFSVSWLNMNAFFVTVGLFLNVTYEHGCNIAP